MSIETPKGETIEAESSSQLYVFDEVGTYSIKYAYSDMFYGGEIAADVNVVPNVLPKFESDKLYTNRYYIKNAEYSLLNVKAWNYTVSGSEVVNTKTYVSYDGGEYAEINPKGFVVAGNSTIKFKTVCVNNKNVYIESDLRKSSTSGIMTTMRSKSQDISMGICLPRLKIGFRYWRHPLPMRILSL